ncbi:MAG: hypothetical protein ABSF56_03375 [Minisyncoccia bacterium]
MNKSGLNGNVSAMAFAGLVLLFVSPFALSNIGDLSNTKWLMVVGAGLFGALGVMSFNGMLAKATPQAVSTLFVLMIVVQTAVPAVYQVIMNGGLSLTKGLGFALAAIAAVLLVKS